MTLQSLKTAIAAQVGSCVWELAAPAGETRGVIIHVYGAEGVLGDNTTQLTVPRVQLDLLWQDPSDTILDDVEDVLRDAFQAFVVDDIAYDDVYACMRAILQLELV